MRYFTFLKVQILDGDIKFMCSKPNLWMSFLRKGKESKSDKEYTFINKQITCNNLLYLVKNNTFHFITKSGINDELKDKFNFFILVFMHAIY